LLDIGVPAGFAYQPDIISSEDERSLVKKFATLSFKPFEFHGYLGNRRIVSYGHLYNYAKQSLQLSQPFPEWLAPLRLVAAGLLSIEAKQLQQALVTEYAPGAGLVGTV